MTMEQSTLDRRDVLAALFPDPDRYLLVAGLAGAARDTAAFTSEVDNLLALGGAMGGAVPMALGMALSAPGDEVAVITGDGELLMNIGALASVASMMPANLSIVCIDNGRHMETGGQPGHTARRTNLAVMADGAGLPSTMTIHSAGELADAAAFLVESPAPRFLCVRVKPGPPAAYKRDWDLAACRLRFRKAYLDRQGTD
jgi:phosphonopyruvate decarboxylase